MNNHLINITAAVEYRNVNGVVSHNGRLEMTPRTIETTIYIASFTTKAGTIRTAKGGSEMSATRNLIRKLALQPNNCTTQRQ